MNSAVEEKTKLLSKYLNIARRIYRINPEDIGNLKYIHVDNGSVALDKECLNIFDIEIKDLLDKASIYYENTLINIFEVNKNAKAILTHYIIDAICKIDNELDAELGNKPVSSLIMTPRSC